MTHQNRSAPLFGSHQGVRARCEQGCERGASTAKDTALPRDPRGRSEGSHPPIQGVVTAISRVRGAGRVPNLQSAAAPAVGHAKGPKNFLGDAAIGVSRSLGPLASLGCPCCTGELARIDSSATAAERAYESTKIRKPERWCTPTPCTIRNHVPPGIRGLVLSYFRIVGDPWSRASGLS